MQLFKELLATETQKLRNSENQFQIFREITQIEKISQTLKYEKELLKSDKIQANLEA